MFTPDERRQKIESYGRAHETLVEALKRFPKEMWKFRPRDGWSIHAIVIHIADSEANSFVRCRRLIAEPGSDVLGYDETLWARVLDYENQSTDDALELFRWLRRTSHSLIQDQPESVARHAIHHSENGPMTFDDWLDVYERHIPEHVAQMERVFQEWQAAR
jgi:hypothetical protein